MSHPPNKLRPSRNVREGWYGGKYSKDGVALWVLGLIHSKLYRTHYKALSLSR